MLPITQLLISPRHGELVAWNRVDVLRSGQDGPQGALSRHARPHVSNDYIAPGSPVELAIADIWQEVLGIAEVGIDDNFFELGGDSLIATQLSARLRDRFQLDVPLRTLFETPTIAHLARMIAGNQENEKLALLNFINQLSEEQIKAEIIKRNLI